MYVVIQIDRFIQVFSKVFLYKGIESRRALFIFYFFFPLFRGRGSVVEDSMYCWSCGAIELWKRLYSSIEE